MSRKRNQSSVIGTGKPEPDDDFSARVEEAAARVGGLTSLARESGISRRMIDRYRGGAGIGRDSLVALARAAGVSVGWLAAGEEPKEHGGAAVDAAGSGERAAEQPGRPVFDELDEILRLVSRPGAVRSYGRARPTIQSILRAIMQHALESGWPAESLERIARIGAILYQIESLTNDEQ